MALITLGSVVSNVSGSIGGTTYARNKGGAYARNRTVPTNPQSALQTQVRATFAQLAARWRAVLTPSQRDAWTAYAENVPLPNRLGQDSFLSGQQFYIRSNSVLILCGGTPADDPPAEFGAGPTLEPTYTVDASADTFTVSDLGGYDPATDGIVAIYFSISPPQNPGVNFFKSGFKRAAASVYPTLASLPTDVALPVPVTAGQKLFIRCSPVLTTGQLGVPVVTPFLTS